MDDKRINASTLSREPTLSKFGSHLRWLIEKSGLDPEKVIVSIGVENNEAQSKFISTMLREYNGAHMQRWDTHPHMVRLHGVHLWVVPNVAPKKRVEEA